MTVGIADWGPLVISTDVDAAILSQLQLWLPTYLKELGTERNLGYVLPTPQSYANSIDVDEILDHQIPAVIVTTARTASVKGGSNFTYEAVWNTTVSVIVRGRRPPESKATAALMEGAVRRAFLQKCRKNGTALNDPHWLGTQVAPVADSTGKGRYLAAGIGTYNVSTDAAAQSFGGPDVPNADSYSPLAVVSAVPTITVQPKS
jgi:hypothetical protein